MNTTENTLKLIGRPGNQPTIKYFENNGMLARFSFFTLEKVVQDDGNTRWKTKWHNVVAWGKVAEEVSRQVKKGVRMVIVGKTNEEKYTDNKGVVRTTQEIVLYNLSVLDKEPA